MTETYQSFLTVSQTVSLTESPAVTEESYLAITQQVAFSGDVNYEVESTFDIVTQWTRPVDYPLSDTLSINQQFSSNPINETNSMLVSDNIQLTSETPYLNSLNVSQEILFVGDIPYDLSSSLSIQDSIVRL